VGILAGGSYGGLDQDRPEAFQRPGVNPRQGAGGDYRPATRKPIYDEFRLSLPEDWRCPCGTLLAGNKSCPTYGRIPLDRPAKPEPDAIKLGRPAGLRRESAEMTIERLDWRKDAL